MGLMEIINIIKAINVAETIFKKAKVCFSFLIMIDFLIILFLLHFLR